MKRKLALSLSAPLVAALCVPTIALGIGGSQPGEAEQPKTTAQTTSAIEVEVEPTPAEARIVMEAVPDEQSTTVDATALETQATTPARGNYYVDDDGNGVCDNYSNGNCASVGNGNGAGVRNGACDGTGANHNDGYGNRGGNGQGAADRFCDGSGRGTNQGGPYGNGNQRR